MDYYWQNLKQRRLFLIICGVIFALFIVVISLLWNKTNKQASQPLQNIASVPTQQQIIQPTRILAVSPSITQNNDWKAYQGNGYIVSTPPNWTITQRSNTLGGETVILQPLSPNKNKYPSISMQTGLLSKAPLSFYKKNFSSLFSNSETPCGVGTGCVSYNGKIGITTIPVYEKSYMFMSKEKSYLITLDYQESQKNDTLESIIDLFVKKLSVAP